MMIIINISSIVALVLLLLLSLWLFGQASQKHVSSDRDRTPSLPGEAAKHIYIYTHIIHTYTYIHVCVCIYVCMYVYIYICIYTRLLLLVCYYILCYIILYDISTMCCYALVCSAPAWPRSHPVAPGGRSHEASWRLAAGGQRKARGKGWYIHIIHICIYD